MICDLFAGREHVRILNVNVHADDDTSHREYWLEWVESNGAQTICGSYLDRESAIEAARSFTLPIAFSKVA